MTSTWTQTGLMRDKESKSVCVYSLANIYIVDLQFIKRFKMPFFLSKPFEEILINLKFSLNYI